MDQLMKSKKSRVASMRRRSYFSDQSRSIFILETEPEGTLRRIDDRCRTLRLKGKGGVILVMRYPHLSGRQKRRPWIVYHLRVF